MSSTKSEIVQYTRHVLNVYKSKSGEELLMIGPNGKKFITELRKLLKEKNMSQSSLAQKAGMNRSSITYIIKNNAIPYDNNLAAIIEALGEGTEPLLAHLMPENKKARGKLSLGISEYGAARVKLDYELSARHTIDLLNFLNGLED